MEPRAMNLPRSEIQKLKKRITELSQAKSHLQMLSDLLTSLAKVSGLKQTLQHSIDMVMETIGATYLIIYYRVEEKWHTYDMFGREGELYEVDDASVARAVETGRLVEDQIETETNALLNQPLTIADWIFPLKVGTQVFGAFKLGGIRLTLAKSVRYQMDVYMSYIGLMLHSEIVNFSRLSDAYEELRRKNKELEREITERRRVQTELVRYRDHLENLVEERTNELKTEKAKAEIANKAKSQFLANMSHEIRTPLNAVTGFSELLSSLVTDSKQKSYIEAIQTAGKSLLTLINDILDLSKIEAGKLEIQYSPVDLKSLLHEVEQIFTVQIMRKKLRFIMRIDEDLPQILLLDEIRLRQILLNLVGNAVKFTDKGHIRLSLKAVNPKREARLFDLKITVEDTGMGISEQDIEHIFESFRQQTGQCQTRFGGTGLGLAICKRLTEMMNGSISVTSAPGKGSSFEIVIRDVETGRLCMPATETDRRHETVMFETGKVLVVDDVESNRELLRELLTQVNLEVLTAENGYEAIVICPEYQPDIILMDLRMPVMNGYEAAKLLKDDPRTRGIPILAVTASSPAIKSERLRREGFEGLIQKPINISMLLSEVSKYFISAKTPRTANPGGDTVTSSLPPDFEKTAEFFALVDALDTDFTETWKSFRHRQPIKKVKAFARALNALGTDNGIHMLEAYGRRLLRHVDNFDVKNMKAAIDEFPDLIDGLKSRRVG